MIRFVLIQNKLLREKFYSFFEFYNNFHRCVCLLCKIDFKKLIF